MRTSYNLLKKYVDLTLSPKELGERFTLNGPEVEEIEQYGLSIEKVVVGEITSKEQHPNADKLTVCKVDVGTELLTIVCGAKNHHAGDKVPVALIGAVLPGGFTIQKAKLRGIESSGMICSRSELGLEAGKSDGVWILDSACEKGKSISCYLPEEDYIYHIALTANRSDCLCTLGLAREAALIENKALKKPEVRISEDSSISRPDISIEANDLCWRYSSRIIKGVKIGESPSWLKEALEKYGARSINNVVDMTNYVMFELGQPMHAFDYNKLAGKKITVRRAKDGEKLKTLDDQEHELTANMLVISDASQAVALAGVMGGANSEVDDHTVDLLLESAYFVPYTVRKTAKLLGMRSESSHRFERDIDPENTVRALDFAAALTVELAGGKISPLTDLKAADFESPEVLVRKSFVRQILGFEIPSEEMERLLNGLEFHFEKQGGDYRVKLPSFRRDCTREIDVVEELIRAYGYDHIPETICSVMMNKENFNAEVKLDNQVKHLLLGLGVHEAYNFSFMNKDSVERFNLLSKDKILTIKNPLNKEFDVLRTGLFASLFQNLKMNNERGNFNVALFEIGKTFWMETNIVEKKKLGILLSGNLKVPNWAVPARKADFYDLKGIVEELFLALKKEQGLTFKSGAVAFLHPGKTAVVSQNGKEVGFLGELHPDVVMTDGIKEPVIYAEIDFELLDQLSARETVCRKVSRFQSAERELAFVMEEKAESETVKKLILNASPLIQSCQVFDVYRGKPIPEGKKSVAFSFVLRAEDRTLTDEEITGIMTSIISQAGTEAGAYLREA